MENLKKDFGSAEILDYSKQGNKDHDFIFTCEHSSNKLPEGLQWSENDKYLEDMHWASDIGALDLTKRLTQYFETLCVYAKYSRLLLDVNRVVVSVSMFRNDVSKRPLDLNKGLGLEDKVDRMQKYFIPYYQALKELIHSVNFKYAFSIHSFNAKAEGDENSDLEIGILNNFYDDLANKFCSEFVRRGYKAKINQPYDGKQGANHAQNNSLALYDNPTRECLLMEIRNDLLMDPVKSEQIYKDFVEIMVGLQREMSKPIDVTEFTNCQIRRYNEDAKVKVVFLAEHGGSQLPANWQWPARDSQLLVSQKLHYGEHTLQLADHLASHFKTTVISSKLSKLVCDLNCQLSHADIFPRTVNGLPVELNLGLTHEQETLRYNEYVMGFLKGVIYLHDIISAHFWFSIQSFPALRYPSVDVILSSYTNLEFTNKVAEGLRKVHYNVLVNPGEFAGDKLFGYANTTFVNGKYPRKRESVIFIFSDQKLKNSFKDIERDLSELIKTNCMKSKD